MKDYKVTLIKSLTFYY